LTFPCADVIVFPRKYEQEFPYAGDELIPIQQATNPTLARNARRLFAALWDQL